MRPDCFSSHRPNRAAGKATRQVRPTRRRLWGHRLRERAIWTRFFRRMIVGMIAAATKRVGPASWAMEAERFWFRHFMARMTAAVMRSISAIMLSGLAEITDVRFVRIFWVG